MNKAVAKLSRAALEIELDSAWEYGRQQEESADGYRKETQRNGWSLRKSYPSDTAIRLIREQFQWWREGSTSAEAALVAIGQAIALRDERVAKIAADEDKAAKA